MVTGLLHKKNIPIQITSILQRQLQAINTTNASLSLSPHNFSSHAAASLNRSTSDPMLTQLFESGDQICVRILKNANPITAVSDMEFSHLKVNFTMFLDSKTIFEASAVKQIFDGGLQKRNCSMTSRYSENFNNNTKLLLSTNQSRHIISSSTQCVQQPNSIANDNGYPPIVSASDGRDNENGPMVASFEDLIRTWRGKPFVRNIAQTQQHKYTKPVGGVVVINDNHSSSRSVKFDGKRVQFNRINVPNTSAVVKTKVVKDAPPFVSKMEEVFLSENQQFRSGAWRRFIMKRSAVDASESRLRAAEREKRKLKSDIGRLAGLDKAISENSDGLGLKTETVWARVHRLGSVIPKSFFPPEIVAQLDYYKNVDDLLAPRKKAIRAGKSFEIDETTKFHKLLDTGGTVATASS